MSPLHLDGYGCLHGGWLSLKWRCCTRNGPTLLTLTLSVLTKLSLEPLIRPLYCILQMHLGGRMGPSGAVLNLSRITRAALQLCVKKSGTKPGHKFILPCRLAAFFVVYAGNSMQLDATATIQSYFMAINMCLGRSCMCHNRVLI